MQRVIDHYVQEPALEEEQLRRHYDNTKFAGLYPDAQSCVWSSLNRACRLSFARYLTVDESRFAQLIDTSAGYAVARDSKAYSAAWNRILQWRKNWLKEYNLQAKELWGAIVKKAECAHYLSLDEVHLRTVYASHFNLESWYQLMVGSTSAFVDWRSTLLLPGAGDFYKTVFVYTLV